MVKDKQVDSYQLNDYAAKFLFTDPRPIPLTFPGHIIAWTDYERTFFNKQECSKIQKKLQTRGKALEQNPLNECLPYLQTDTKSFEHEEIVKKLKTNPIKIKTFVKHVRSNPNINVYLYSSELDARVPKEDFNNEVKALRGSPNFKYINLKNSGHEGFMSEASLLEMLIKESMSL